MTTKILHEANKHIDLVHNDKRLFRYVYETENQLKRWAPRPFFYPIKTLGGQNVTIYRPNDHAWHVGLSFTINNVSGRNFWGGPTYSKKYIAAGIEDGYRGVNNHGSQIHQDWEQITHRDGAFHADQRLTWIDTKGEKIFEEARSLSVPMISEEGGFWVLDFSTHLSNVSGEDLELGTYKSSEGLEGSHYTGLLFRGRREYVHFYHDWSESEWSDDVDADLSRKNLAFGYGGLIAAGGLSGQDAIHGASLPWIAMNGTHDGTQAKSSVVFIDHPDNPNYPNHWFARPETAIVAFPFHYENPYQLERGGSLKLKHRLIFCDQHWTEEKLATLMATSLPDF